MKGIGMTDIFKKLMLRVAEFMEIILAIYLVVVLILVIGRTIVVETPMIFTEMTSIHHFLELSLTLAVAIEFVKMLCMHTPGTLIEVYATTMHYAPCQASKDKGFRVLVALPEGTNTEMPQTEGKSSEDRLLFARNKWLIAHADAPEAGKGAFVGIRGENIDIAGEI